MSRSLRPAADELFDLVDLPGAGPVHLAIAFPSGRLRAMPAFPPAALPESGRIAAGRGLTVEACHRSSLGEAAELASCCDWGDHALVSGTDKEIGPAALLPEALNGFTAEQLRRRGRWNDRHAALDWRPPPRDRAVRLDWVAVADGYGGADRYAPADFVFIGRREAGDERAVAIGDSNGCAAGPDTETAKAAAVLELIERDATGLWWYGRQRRPKLGVGVIEGVGHITDWLAERGRRTWVIDITSDLPVPVAAAVSAEVDGRDVALGFAARADWNSAAIAALSEMLQMEVSLDAARALGGQAGAWADWRRTVCMTTPPLDAATDSPRAAAALPAPLGGLPQILEGCAKGGVDLWFVDMTRPAIGSPVCRALSTTLCHWRPRFLRQRLRIGDTQPAPLTDTSSGPLLLI